MSEDAIIRVLSSSPLAVAILALGWLARRALFPFVERLWERHEKQLDLNRQAAERRTATGADIVQALDRVARALERREPRDTDKPLPMLRPRRENQA